MSTDFIRSSGIQTYNWCIVSETQGHKAKLIFMSFDTDRYWEEHKGMFATIGGEVVMFDNAQSHIGPNTLVRNMPVDTTPEAVAMAGKALLPSPPAIYIGQKVERCFVQDLGTFREQSKT